MFDHMYVYIRLWLTMHIHQIQLQLHLVCEYTMSPSFSFHRPSCSSVRLLSHYIYMSISKLCKAMPIKECAKRLFEIV